MVPSVEVAGKLADGFGVTLNCLVDDTGKVSELKNKAILKRLTDVEQLDEEERNLILKVVDSRLRDAKAKKAYGV